MNSFFNKKSNQPHKNESSRPSMHLEISSIISTMGGIPTVWSELLKSQNTAVDEYQNYKQFINKIESSQQNIDFNRTLFILSKGSDELKLTSAEGMYLLILDFDEDESFLASEHASSEIFRLDKTAYKKIHNLLNQYELEYLSQIKNYLSNSIKPILDKASVNVFGYEKACYLLPLNTINCNQYHRFLACLDNFDDFSNLKIDDSTRKQWRQIKNAPLFERRTTEESPVIPIGIHYMDVFILDILCYANMMAPTIDLQRVLNYKDKRGTQVKYAIDEAYGLGTTETILNTVYDLNCSLFRSSVRQGIDIK